MILTEKADFKDIAQLNEVQTYLARTSLYYLNKSVLGFTDFTPEPHKQLCDWVQSFNGYQRELLLMSRNSFKTSAVSIGYSIQTLLNDPNKTILLVGQERSYAETILNLIKMKMETSEKLIALNGGPFHGKWGWKEYEIFVKGRTDWISKEPSIGTAGMDSVKAGPHYDLIIVDDPESDSNTTTIDSTDKLIRNYKYLSPMLRPGGKMIVIGTPYSFDALYYYILNNPAELVNFKVLIGQARKDSAILPDVPKEFVHLPQGPEGTLLMPNVLTEKLLNNEEDRDPSFFASQYLVSVVSGEAQEFQKEWFRYFLREELPGQLRVYSMLDPAFSLRNTACYTSILVGGVDQLNNIFILKVINERIDPTSIIDHHYSIFREYYRPYKMGIEVNGLQAMLRWAFDQAQMERGFLPIFPITVRKASKKARIRGLIKPYQDGRIYHLAANHNKNSVHPSQAVLESQLLRFPGTTKDDAIDAEAGLLELIDVRGRRSTVKRQKTYEPADALTGY